MATRTVRANLRVDGTLTSASAAVLSDSTGTYGIKRDDNDAVVVAAGTVMTESQTGVYEYTFTEPAEALEYTAWAKLTYNGIDYYQEIDVGAASVSTSMLVTYDRLLKIVGRKWFGIRTGFSSAQVDDLNDIIEMGLRDVYGAYDWSFLHSRQPVTTVAPYTTGTITVSSGVVTLAGGTWPSWAAVGVLKVTISGVIYYYRVSSRDSDSQITLEDTSVDVAAGTSYSLGCPEYDLPAAYDGLESKLTFEPEASDQYPPIKIVSEERIRSKRQDHEYEDRPLWAAIINKSFDADEGSKKRVVFYPTPDARYVMNAWMHLRPTMINDSNQYPLGGEVLGYAIIEACLAAGGRFLEDSGATTHEAKFEKALQEAIKRDQETSSPPWLGKDEGDEDDTEWPPVLVGAITINGVEM